jgi:hypothetical protein
MKPRPALLHGIACGVLAIQGDGAGGGCFQAGEQAKERGLARP